MFTSASIDQKWSFNILHKSIQPFKTRNFLLYSSSYIRLYESRPLTCASYMLWCVIVIWYKVILIKFWQTFLGRRIFRIRSSRLWVRSCRVWMRSSRVWMRSSRVVRASDNLCCSRNCLGFDPSILRHSGIWGAADEAVLNIVHKKTKKIPPWIFRYGTLQP